MPISDTVLSIDRNGLLYLDLLKKCLTHYLWDEEIRLVGVRPGLPFRERTLVKVANKVLASTKYEVAEPTRVDLVLRENGGDWPLQAHTMIGLKRLNNLQACIAGVLENDVPGDLIETGVWRGGATIFMRAILKTYGITNRTVWVADSFRGLPQPDEEHYPADSGAIYHTYDALRCSLENVKENFAKYGMLDDQVHFLEGWFKDTLPNAPIKQLAVMRLDGDMYESTMDALVNLFPKLSVGGFVIIDDFLLQGCREAVYDFRAANHIANEIKDVDGTCAYWQNNREPF